MRPNNSSQLIVRSWQRGFPKSQLRTASRQLLTFFIFWICSLGWAQPAPPSGLAVAAPYDGEVNLIWTPNAVASPTVTAYFISRELVDLTNTPTPNPTGTPTPIATVLLSSMSGPGTAIYQDFQVTNGQNYLYQVWGQDSGGTGSSASVTARPFLAPVAVQPLTVQNIHSNALDLSWGVPNSSYPVSYYQVYLYEPPTPTATPNLFFTPTFTPAGTLTPSPTPTFPQTPVPASTVAAATPLATVFTNSYSDTTANTSGFAAFNYLSLALTAKTIRAPCPLMLPTPPCPTIWPLPGLPRSQHWWPSPLRRSSGPMATGPGSSGIPPWVRKG